MIRRSLEMILSRSPDGVLVLTAPALGVYGDPPRPGEGLIAGSFAGTLLVLGRTVDLLVPEGGAGTVAEVHVQHRKTPVAFQQPLLSLLVETKPSRPRARSAAQKKIPSDGPASGADASGAAPSAPGSPVAARAGRERGGASPDLRPEDSLPAGSYALRAPTTGIFYARPDPDSPPFVVEGSRLEAGQTAGLIEVMKCFSPIVHPGGSIPSPAVVESMRVREGQEVRPGTILFVLRHP